MITLFISVASYFSVKSAVDFDGHWALVFVHNTETGSKPLPRQSSVSIRSYDEKFKQMVDQPIFPLLQTGKGSNIVYGQVCFDNMPADLGGHNVVGAWWEAVQKKRRETV